MQDRKDIQYNPGLVDEGWDHMRKQLDEAMPVQQTDRRRWWLFLFFGLSLLGVAYMAFSNVFFIKNTVDNTSIEAPIIAPETQLQEPVIAPVLDETPLTEEASPVDAPRASLPVQSTPQNTPTVSNNNFTSTEASTHVENIETTNSIETTVSEITEPAIQSTAVESLVEAREEIGSAQDHSPEAKIYHEIHAPTRNVKDIASTAYVATITDLQIYDTSPIGGDLLTESLQVLEDAKSSIVKPNKLNIFAEGNIAVGLGDPAQMISIGAGVEKAVGKNWTIGGLLSYQRQHIGALNIAANQNSSIAGAFDSDENRLIAVNSDGSFSEIGDILNQRIALNLNGNFRPKNSRFRFSSGLSVAYFLTSEAPISINEPASYLPQEGLFLDVYNSPISQSFEANEAVANNGPIPSVRPTRLELAYHLGLGYAIGAKTELRANFSGLLNDWPVKNNPLGPKTRLSLGLRYYF